MKHFALLFYPTRTFTAEEQSRRAAAIPVWIKQVTEMGITMDPKAFGETVATFSATGSETDSPNGSAVTPRLTNIVFFDAPSKEEAIKVARIHPALHYGVIVDVREWTVPGQPSVATDSPVTRSAR